MLQGTLLEQAEALHKLGFGILWLHERTKRPVGEKWARKVRKSWDELIKEYREGNNVGVLLGEASKVKDGFLAVADLDVKSKLAYHREEALKQLAEFNANLADPKTVRVTSGRGNGSCHIYFLTKGSISSTTPFKSKDDVKVPMPSQPASKRELGALTAEEIAMGLRLRPAWEISIMSAGRQVVLPPSIHPDSGKAYEWEVNPFEGNLHFLTLSETEKPVSKISDKAVLGGFVPEEIDVEMLPIPDKILNMITTGDGAENRSDVLPMIARALVNAECTKNEVLTILSDRKHYLGAVGYDHTKSNDRKVAVEWLWKYTVKKVFKEFEDEFNFRDEDDKILNPEELKELEKEFEDGKTWQDSLDRTAKGAVKSSLINGISIMKHSTSPGFLRRNEFSDRMIWTNDVPWREFGKGADGLNERDLIKFKRWCGETFRFEPPKQLVDEMYTCIAEENKFHPVRDYLLGLRWDGVSRINTWLKDYAGATTHDSTGVYLSAVSRKVLVGMVTRIMVPGKKFDTVLILEGNQGAGKSRLVEAIASTEWFSDAPMDFGHKDVIGLMKGKWVIEIGELSSMRKADVEQLKAFISQNEDRAREAYKILVEDFPRQTVFIGTTNGDKYLKDLSGNRRFWPVHVAPKIDVNGFKKIRDQLFAEAMFLFEAGEPVYLSEEENKIAKLEQNERMIEDVYVPPVQKAVEQHYKNGEWVTTHQVADWMGISFIKTPDASRRIGVALRELGFEKDRPRINGVKTNAYLRKVEDLFD